MIILQIYRSCLGADLLGTLQGNVDGHTGIAPTSETATDTRDNDAVSSVVGVLGALTYASIPRQLKAAYPSRRILQNSARGKGEGGP